jgi:two-component system chemotaxis sensor kinase CheA
MSNGIDRVLSDFILESRENLERLDHEFVALESDPDNNELLASIFRTIHTIKGSAGFLSLTNLEQVSHYAEDVLARLREHSLELSTDIITILLSAVDCIKTILFNLEKIGEEGEHDVLDIVMQLKNIAAGKPIQVPEISLVEEFDEPRTDISIPGELSVSGQDEILSPPAIEEEEREVESQAKAQKISETVEHALSSVEETRIHVDITLLDRLMNLTGELVLSRNQVIQFASEIDERNFRAIAQRMSVVVSELQETVMKTRMQQVKKVFGMLPRLVRDLSKLNGKNIRLRMEGQNTELDRTLLEAVKDPLTHLVRNAIDHGIETPDVRKRQGKPPQGTVFIHAYHEGGQVNIEISDDGSGIDIQRIKAKAIREEIVTPQRAEELSERELLNMIFRPGFSTAKTITNISGRGVGMDVVKKNLDQIGGSIEIHTEVNKGTTVKIRIPITLAIIPVLIVKSAEQRFAIPQVNLEELVMLQSENGKRAGIEVVHGAEVHRLRGELLPLLRLNNILKLSAQEESEQGNTNIVVLSAGPLRFGLIVDHVGDTEEIVVKSISKHVKQIPCYDGATIMGDGKVVLILNVNGLFATTQFTLEDMKQVEEAGRESEEQTQALTQEEHRQTIVLFKVGSDEYYGVPLAFVVRLEKFPASQIEHSGGREVLQYRNDILPVIRLENYLNLPTSPDPEMLSLIVFAIEKQIGLVVTEILDTVEISTHIDTETFQQKGILGSTIIQGHSVLILDIHGLIEMAYPTWYKKFFVSKLSEAERQQIRVLLVEDSPFFLNIEKSYLEAAGYQVSTATHGNEALEKLEKRPVDVVVTDIAMPYCNGYELTKAIKTNEEWQHIPVMALTALSGEEDRKKGIEAGIDEYQIKLDREEVLRALELLILRTRK